MAVQRLVPGKVTLADLEGVYYGSRTVQIDPDCRGAVEAAAKVVADAAAGNKAVYGVNTGFGKLASVKIAAKDTATLQRNLVLSHCCGVGDPTEPEIVRLMMILKLLSLGRGASGVRWCVIDQIEAMLANDILPAVPSQGSVGASGDLAPLAHMASAMIGEGDVLVSGKPFPADKALRNAGLKPLVLEAKEGLAMINGTQFCTAYALGALFNAWRNVEAAIITSALSTDAIMGSTAPLRAEIHALRGDRKSVV